VNREKVVHVAILESLDEEALKRALGQINSKSKINFMVYKIEDSRLRIVFAALKEAVSASQ
jgi:hypothetical protein